MSQWNNTFSYNNQFQGGSSWNGDLNRQYLNQAFYSGGQYNPSNQYVNFEQFLSRMQGGNVPLPAANFPNVQYQNYSNNQFNYQQNIPPQNNQVNYSYTVNTPNVPNRVESYPVNIQNQFNQASQNTTFDNEVVSKSKLTATATEFVPKNSASTPAPNSLDMPEETSSSCTSLNESSNISNKASSSETNWRDRPHGSQQNPIGESSKWFKKFQSQDKATGRNDHVANGYSSENNSQNSKPNSHESNESSDTDNSISKNIPISINKKSNERTNESNCQKIAPSTSNTELKNHKRSNNQKSNNQKTEFRNQSYESTSHNPDSNEFNGPSSSKSYDSYNRRNNSNGRQETNSRNHDRNNESNGRYESSNSNNESYNRTDNPRHQESYSRNHISNRKHDNPQQDSNYRRQDRNQESNQRNYDSSNHRSNRNQDSSYYQDANDHYSDNNRYYESNKHNDGGQSKSNYKSKSKESDRMFYNSGMPKSTQDVRNVRGESSGRHWAGSQRLRAGDRNSIEDEQYANSYTHPREGKSHKESTSSPMRNRHKKTDNTYVTANTELTQRERLSEQLDRGTLECLVCCERVVQIDYVWSCSNCYHVLHLKCIRKWAHSSLVEGKWRCPACQNTNDEVPTEYRCMCGTYRNPEYQRGSHGAHTCGKSCKRPRSCPHPCTLLCHPGPCPPCQATVTKKCGCGAETRSVLCSSKLPQVCSRKCRRQLQCQVHECERDCHEGPCDTCSEIVTQVCYCLAAKSRSVACTEESGTQDKWSCGEVCGRILSCGAHVCRRACHPPPCDACPMRPDNVITCPCGRTRLEKDQRKSCTDAVPLCGNICTKPLSCGPAGDKHFCKESCHEGQCRVCPDKTVLQCRCGHSTREVPCSELPDMLNNVLCQKKCNKKLSCGRHRCRTVCCDAQSHRCAVVCGRTLSCQTHRCEEFCHTGHCAPCPRVGWEELRCECGTEVVLPPVRCGARPPACSAPCRRPRPCRHPPHHSCHAGPCPPCVVLTTKTCHGQHEERKTIPCSQEEFSCGLPCGKPLPCGKHTCIKTCHKGACDTGKCSQPCVEKRATCGHACAAPCHAGSGAACPSGAPCRRPVTATCPCGRRTADRACCDNARDHAKMMSTLAATKMQEGGSVDLTDVQRPGSMLKTLECDDECRMEARSRQLALALQIRNPDVSAKLAPRYSEHVRATAAREPAFAQQIHDKLTDLVQLAKKSKQKTRAHSFPSMNRQKRQFIHEMCEHFGCESVAYDAEPNRNVVATADREKSWLPAMSVLEVLGREAGKRRVPGPVLRAPHSPAHQANSRPSGWATLTSTNAWASRSQPKPAEPKVDYFDNPPDN